MSFVELVPVRREHVPPIARRMREWDRIEAQAMGHSPAIALRLGIVASIDCFTVLIDGTPEGVIGLVPKNALEGEGSPWMLGTEAIYRNPRALMVLSRRMIRIWGDSLPHLANLVAAENVRAIRYLRRLGFEVGDERVAVGGVDFVTFTLDADDV